MTIPNRKGWLAIAAVVLILGIPFALVFYISSDTYNERHRNWRQKSSEAHLPARSKVTTDQVTLIRDERVVVGRTCLVFKDAVDNQVKLDLHLLDLDPEQAYHLSIPAKNANKAFWVDNTRYSLVSVNNRSLKLKILDQYQTP